MWVHTIEDTPEGEAYKESVERFNEKYDGTYFADIEFIPRNDSGVSVFLTSTALPRWREYPNMRSASLEMPLILPLFRPECTFLIHKPKRAFSN